MRKIRLIFPITVFLAAILVSPVAAQTPHRTGILSTLTNDRPLLIISAVFTLFNILLAFILSKKSVSLLQLGLIGLGSMTAFLHLGIGLRGRGLLLLNGLGYVGLIYALLLPISFLVARRIWIYWLLLAYTAITFIGYFATHSVSMFSWMAILTKVVELGLMGLLLVRIWQNRRTPSQGASPAVNID